MPEKRQERSRRPDSAPGDEELERGFSLEDILSPEELERLSTLRLFDFVTRGLVGSGKDPYGLRRLRDRIEEMEEIQDHAHRALEQLSATVDKLKSPALRMGTLLQRLPEDRAIVCVNGTDYLCSVNPALPSIIQEVGMRVLLNEAFAVVDSFGYDKSGPIVRVAETLSDGRVRVGSEHGLSDSIVVRSALLSKEEIKTGLDVRLDSNQRVVVELLALAGRMDRTFSSIEKVAWEQVGGQEEAIESIRDTIELPYLHGRLFRRFNHPAPKGFLLHGPPGCGKTLMGKATAHNLRTRISENTGEDHPEFFLHVKGPEILNMWLGESERQVRDLFAQCREKSAQGHLAFLFIDEAESILGTRAAGRLGSNILSTIVPMFCAEMDGLVPLDGVVVILASNRADLIDPAILRPGRIDRKIRVRRPDAKAGEEIYRIYLTDDLPLDAPREDLIREVVSAHYAETEENRFLEISYRSGRREYVFRGGLSSGAVIAAVVERAKQFAIKRSVREEKESGITKDDLISALDEEYIESELFPPTDLTEDWLKLTDFDPSNVISLRPYQERAKFRRMPSI